MYPQKTYSLTELVNRFTNWYFNLSLGKQLALLLGVAIIIAENSPKTNYYAPKSMPLKRKDFPENTKKSTLTKQWNLCNNCKKPSKHWDFHHIDGNRSNNRPSNCEALCPNCHAEKTRTKKIQF